MALDTEGHLVAANSLYCSLLGVEEHRLPLGQCLLDHWPSSADDLPALASFLQGTSGALEMAINRRPGQELMIRLSHRKIREAEDFPDLRIFTIMESATHEDVLEALRSSEERFRAVADAVSDHVLELDEEGNITFSSIDDTTAPTMPFPLTAGYNYFTQIKHFSQRPDTQIVWDEDCSLFRAHEPFTNLRSEITEANGRTHIWLRSGTPRFDSNGDFLGYNLVLRDISDSPERERKLVRSEMRLKGIVDNAAVGIITVDEMANIESYNAEAERIFGFRASEVMGCSLAILMPHEDRQDNLAGFHQYLMTGENDFVGSQPRARRGMRKDGSIFPMELTIAELVVDGRRIFIGSFRDITETQQAEQQLHQAQKMDAVGQMTGGIAHDFNNLLGTVSLNLELLELAETHQDPQTAETLTAIRDVVERGASLTKRLLTFSRQETVQRQPVAVASLIEDLRLLMDRTLPASIDISTSMDNQLWHADTDPHQLENALLNLAINARDAMMDSGSLTFEAFNLHYEQSSEDLPPGDYVVLSVRDNGPGMDDETRMRVLEPFFTTKPAGQGTGLGLSMVYGFVRQNGGQLIIDTAPGQGTSISLILPRAHQITDQVEAKVAVDVADSLQDLNVLLVEDDKGMQSVLNTVLQDEGCSVEALSDGPAAEEWLRQAPGTPDVLLTDLVLPGGTNGLDLARKLEAVAPDCAIIFMSGYLDDELKDWRDELHDSFFLNKPFSRQELRDTVTSALSGKQA